MKDERVLGLCIVVAAIILAVSIWNHAQTGRYETITSNPHDLRRLDTATGKIISIQTGKEWKP